MDTIIATIGVIIGFFILAPTIIIISKVIYEEKKRRYENARLREVEGYPPKKGGKK